ncbi:E3 ubiquitin ligase, partial [Teratosphaeriaceae sp. CCFEE 6253]
MASIGATVAHHDGGNPRKRLKMSRPHATLSNPDDSTAMSTTLTSAAADKTESSSMAQTRVHEGPCHHESALKSLHADVDAMRHLVTCQICHRFMYEPYALSCGHTYCYSCLTQWLGSNAKKTCPDCRAVITQQPTASYVIRELVLIFASRNQLLPDGETAE